jgi:hypothetical protein
MSEDTYDFEKIEDKRNFADHLNVQVPFEQPFFEEDERLLTSYTDKTTETNQPDALVTNLVSEIPKGIIRVENSYFHYFSDFIGPIYVFLKNCVENNIPEVEIIGVELEPELTVVKNFSPFLEHCLQHFSDQIIVTYKQISENSKLSDFDKGFIKINKSRVLDQQDIAKSINFLYEKSKSFSGIDDSVVPNKKVFISRRDDSIADHEPTRHLYEQDVEEFFESIGFEIISGENFESLSSQMSYFNDVSVFAGFSGSGLTSLMFMQPEQTAIEIVCPLRFSDDPRYEIHNFYKTISMLKKHKYVAVSNINNSKEELLKQLEAVTKML